MSRLWLKWQDLFSFEFIFLLFVIAASYKSIPLLEGFNEKADLTLLTAIIGSVCGIVVVGRRKFSMSVRTRSFLFLYLLYVGCALLTYYCGGIFSDNANLKVQKLLVFNTFSVFAPLFVINTRERVERFLRLLFFSIVGMTLYATVSTQLLGSSRFVGTFGSDSYQLLGVLAAMGLAMILVIMVLSEQRRMSLSLAAAGSVMLMAVVLSGARQALAGFLMVGVFVVYTVCRSSKSSRLFARYVPAIVLMAALFLIVKTHVFSSVDTTWGASRLLNSLATINRVPTTGENRPMLWSSGLRVWARHPILGAGFGSFSVAGDYPDARQPHNLFIEMLSDMGIIGLLIGCAMWAYPWRTALRSIRRTKDPALVILTALWLHNLTCALFSGDVTDNRIMFTFAALIISQCNVVATNRTEPQSGFRKQPRDVTTRAPLPSP